MTDLLGLPLDWRLALAAAAVFVGGFMRGFVGFGAALVIVPVLSLAYGPRMAVPALTVMGVPTLFQLLPDAIRTSERAIVAPVCLAILAAAPFGTWVLTAADPALMKIVISGLVVAMAAMLALDWKLRRQVGTPILVGAGIAGGLVQGVAGIGGPPVVAIALSREGPAAQQRGNVLAMMTAVSISTLAPQLYFGLFTKASIVLGLILLPVYGGSILLGSRYFSRGGDRHFRRAALAMLMAIGLATLIAALRDYAAG
jgi:hypothetical protein